MKRSRLVATMNRLILALSLSLTALASAYAADGLVVEDAWVREAPPGARALAGYMTIRNTGEQDRRLVSARGADFDAVELHRSLVEDGVARMLPQQFMPIPAGGELVLEPGGYHLMLMRPKSALKEGDRVGLSLGFDDGSTLEVDLPVRKASGGDHEHMHHHHHH